MEKASTEEYLVRYSSARKISKRVIKRKWLVYEYHGEKKKVFSG